MNDKKSLKELTLSEIYNIKWEGSFDDITAKKEDSILRVEQMTSTVWWWKTIVGNKMKTGYSQSKLDAKEQAILAYNDFTIP